MNEPQSYLSVWRKRSVKSYITLYQDIHFLTELGNVCHLYSHLLIKLFFLQIKIYETKKCLFSTTTQELDYVYASESQMSVVSLQIDRKNASTLVEKSV